MKTRIITAIVAIAVFIPFLYFSNTWAFSLLAVLLCLISAYEILNCLGFLKNTPVAAPTFAVAALIPLLARLIETKTYIIVMSAIMFLYLFAMFAVSVAFHEKIDLKNAVLCAAFSIYVFFGFTSLILLRDMEHGSYIYLITFVAPWMCDTFAYFGGSFFGKHKLIPAISPKKTVEGAIIGTVFGALSVVLYGFIVSLIFKVNANYLALALAGLILTVISQFGDLIASAVKRLFGIKDYGKLFPGHGGVLDRFDSVIAAASFLCVFCAATGNVLSLFS